MSAGPLVVLGLPARDGALHLPQALESLLGQTYRDFALLLVDDNSSDATVEIARHYASYDGRITVLRNERTLGLAANWTHTFSLSRKLYPGAGLFAWASDHDVWHREWLAELVRALDQEPQCVLAYPLVRPIAENGREARVESRRFDTNGVSDERERLRRAMRRMSAGNMVYGLFRVDALECCGALRSLLIADRLLLAQMSALGEFKQVPRFLWYRRYRGIAPTLARQRRSLFPERAPMRSYAPWQLAHAAVFLWSFGVRGDARPQLGAPARDGACAPASHDLDLHRGAQAARRALEVPAAGAKAASARAPACRRRTSPSCRRYRRPTSAEAGFVTDTAFERELEELRASPAYRNYLAARGHVLRMKAADTDDQVARPSDYWSEELENLDYLLDASPLVIRRLRHHCHHVTGIRVYDYRSRRDSFRNRIEEKLRLLIEHGGPELLVPEPPDLGGFGFEIDGGLINLDTLKFYEALIALERAEVLEQFRRPGERRLAVEIGSGWGGFAYQFKTLFPDATYVIVDLPELLVFSAVYLMSLFPRAHVAFWGDPEQPDAFAPEPDFVFVPHTALAELRSPRLDLMLNMVSFQEMTTDQVRAYVDWAHGAGAPYLYSLNRDRSAYNTQLTSVREVMAERFWLHEIDVLPMSYVTMVDEHRKGVERAAKKGMQAPGGDTYRHVVGWPRLETIKDGASLSSPTSVRLGS